MEPTTPTNSPILPRIVPAARQPTRPSARPKNPCFSSGPCAKRPGWSVAALELALVGRSHRSSEGRARLREAIERSSRLLGLPDGYRLGIVGGSDTGAVEMALWSLLGARGVDVLAWESFGKGWVTDIVQELRLDDVRVMEADYGELPDLTQVDCDRDVVFTWNGTTSGVRVPDGDWIPGDRQGLTICDATSAVFAMDLPWAKLDVVTYSWQKVLGGEAQHGVIVLGPRAVERLESYTPPRPIPKLFRLSQKGRLIDGVYQGDTINTPSLLCVEDVLDGLKWAEAIGGLPALVARSRRNLAAVERWVENCDFCEFLARDAKVRSSTSICLRLLDGAGGDAASIAKDIVKTLEAEKVAYDIGSYRDAPAGLRVWGGATVETSDLEALFPWLDWACSAARAV